MNNIKTPRQITRFSQDSAAVQEIIKALQDNDGYCPCSIEQTADTKCPCREFQDMNEGECHCGLYIKTWQ